MALMVRHPNAALPFGIAHVALESLGLADDRFGAAVRAALSSGHVHSIERLPYRRLEIAWLAALLDGGPVDYESAWSGCIINERPHPFHMTTADVYALTHAVFFTTDFGRQSIPPEVCISSLRQCLDSCMSWQLYDENVDTLGELLASALLLRVPLSPTATACWRAVESLWQELGFLPGPGLEADTFGDLAGLERAAYVFKNTYHTMYVGGILHAVFLQLGGPAGAQNWARHHADALLPGSTSPYLVGLVDKHEQGLPATLAAEAAAIGAGRAGAYDDLARLTRSSAAGQLTAYTAAEASRLLSRHAATKSLEDRIVGR